MNDILKDYFIEKEQKEYKSTLTRLADHLKEIRKIFLNCLKYVLDKHEKDFQDVAAKELVELYSFLFTGYLLIEEAEKEHKKIFIANRYIVGSLAKAHNNAEIIKNEQFSDLLHADEILQG